MAGFPNNALSIQQGSTIDTAFVDSAIANASNIRSGDNPVFTVQDFLSFYRQFALPLGAGETSYTPLAELPEEVIEEYIVDADSRIKEARWHTSWKNGMRLYVAHFCTLYLKGAAAVGSGAAAVFQAGMAQGVDTSRSVSGVSKSTDYSAIDSPGWGTLKITIYGQQFLSMARLFGKGGMGVW